MKIRMAGYSLPCVVVLSIVERSAPDCDEGVADLAVFEKVESSGGRRFVASSLQAFVPWPERFGV
jgi:hypothetical protein